jgi:hypothetical protein
MKVQQLLEATKYLDKDGKTVHRIQKNIAPRSVAFDAPAPPPPKEKKKKSVWPNNPFATPPESEMFGKAGYVPPIRRRKRGEGSDPDYLYGVYEINGVAYKGKEKVGTVHTRGSSFLQHPLTELWHEAETLEIHFDNGAIVPAIRLRKNSPISQDYRWKGRVPFLSDLYVGDDDEMKQRLAAADEKINKKKKK